MLHLEASASASASGVRCGSRLDLRDDPETRSPRGWQGWPVAEDVDAGGSGRRRYTGVESILDLPGASTERSLRKRQVLADGEHLLECMGGVVDRMSFDGVVEELTTPRLLRLRIPTDRVRRTTYCAYTSRALLFIGVSRLHAADLAFVWTINVNADASLTFVYTEPQTAPEPRLGRVVWRPDNPDDIPDLDGFVERLVSHQRARIASLADDSQAELFEKYKALLSAGLVDP